MKKRLCMVIFLVIFSNSLFFAKTYNETYKVTSLNGVWQFYWNTLITMPNPNIRNESVIVPSSWKYYKYGYGTYSITLTNLDPSMKYAIMMYESPGTSANGFVNGKYISSCGTVSTTIGKGSCSKPWIVSFVPDEKGKAVIAIQVSNWVYRKAGLWSTVYFGSYANIINLFNWRVLFSSLALGVLLFLFIVSLILFFLDRTQISNLYFAIIAFIMIARVLTAEFSLIMIIFPSFSYTLARKLEYIIVWAGLPFYSFLLNSIFPKLNLIQGRRKIIPMAVLSLGTIVSFLPLSICCYFVTPFIAMSFIMIMIICYVSVKNYKELKIEDKHQLISLFIILIIISSFLLSSWAVVTSYNSLKISVVPILFIMFAIMQFLSISYNQSKLFHSRVIQSEELKKLNEAYVRFVPKEFLKLLGKKSVTEVNLGDHVEADMTLLFITLKIPSDMEEQFKSISDFSRQAVDIISKNNGYLSKFINKGILAIFPESPCDAVKCSLELQKISLNCNIEGVYSGIHFGKMIVGTIGEENRLDDTVISNTVNTAFRIMEYSTRTKTPIVVSEEVVKQTLGKNTGMIYEKIGKIDVKGKVDPLIVYSGKKVDSENTSGGA